MKFSQFGSSTRNTDVVFDLSSTLASIMLSARLKTMNRGGVPKVTTANSSSLEVAIPLKTPSKALN